MRLADLDDDVLVAVTTPDMLEREGCRISWVDRRLADVRLPRGEDAHGLARKLARLHPDLPIILCRPERDRMGRSPAWVPLSPGFSPDQQVGRMGALL